MNKQNATTSILILGVVILCIFSYVVAVNVLPNNTSSDSYFSKVDSNMEAKIEHYEILDGKLAVYTTGTNPSICVKTTKSSPKFNSLCWIETENNVAKTSVYPNKNYYIWIKDRNGNISSPKTYYTEQ